MVIATKDRYIEGMITAGIIFGLYHLYKENLKLKKEVKSLKGKVTVSNTFGNTVNKVKDALNK